MNPNGCAIPRVRSGRKWLSLAVGFFVLAACSSPAPDAPGSARAPEGGTADDAFVTSELEPGSEPQPEPSPASGRDDVRLAMDWRDVQEIEALLGAFTRAYNGGAYDRAAALFTRRVDEACEGGLAAALERNHARDRIDYVFLDVFPWRDDPRRADVIVVERWAGNQADMPTGLAFDREDGRWLLDVIFPLGADGFCS